jgi:hypothetical protein
MKRPHDLGLQLVACRGIFEYRTRTARPSFDQEDGIWIESPQDIEIRIDPTVVPDLRYTPFEMCRV